MTKKASKTSAEVAKKAADNTTKKATTTMNKDKTTSKEAKASASPSHPIDARIAALARMRALIRPAGPDMAPSDRLPSR